MLHRRLRLLACSLGLVLCSHAASAQGRSLSLGHSPRHSGVRVTLGDRAPSRPLARAWIEGRYETRVERVWIEGCERQVWAPARYELRRDACGRERWVLVCPGSWRTVRDPGRFEAREVQVWVPAHWRDAPHY